MSRKRSNNYYTLRSHPLSSQCMDMLYNACIKYVNMCVVFVCAYMCLMEGITFSFLFSTKTVPLDLSCPNWTACCFLSLATLTNPSPRAKVIHQIPPLSNTWEHAGWHYSLVERRPFYRVFIPPLIKRPRP